MDWVGMFGYINPSQKEVLIERVGGGFAMRLGSAKACALPIGINIAAC